MVEWSVRHHADVEQESVGTANFQDAYRRASEAAVDIGKTVRHRPADLHILLLEISSARQQRRAYEFGQGLAQGCLDLDEMWSALKAAYATTAADCRDHTMMGGFLAEAHAQTQLSPRPALDAAIDEPDLAPSLPYLQARVAIDEAGIARLRTAIAKGALSSNDLLWIANGSIESATPTDLKDLLGDVAGLPGGVGGRDHGAAHVFPLSPEGPETVRPSVEKHRPRPAPKD